MRFLSFFLSLFLLTGVSHCWGQSYSYENRAIEDIFIIVVDEGSAATGTESSIRSRLKTQKGNGFSHALFDEDLKMLSQDYARVEPELQQDSERVTITLRLYPKPTIRSVRFLGNQDYCCHELLSELEVAQNETYDRIAFHRAFQKLKGFYVKKGYFESKLTYQVEEDPITNQVDITVTIDEGRHGKIRQIDFLGLTSAEELYIMDTMGTKLYNLLTGWVTGEGIYNEEMVRQDEFIIADYLHNKGYADASVSIEVQELGSNKLGLLVRVNKGPLYRFGSVSFAGQCIFDELTLRQSLLFREGDAFSADLLRGSLQNLRDAYGRIGYIDAFTNYEIYLNPETCDYHIHFTIEENQCYRVGLIKVFGNYNTHTRIILLDSLLIPGEVFNADKLRKTEARLMNIGFFSNVNVYAVKSAESSLFGPEYRDVHIEVEECGTGNFSLSAGFSNIENLFGVFEITERNFNICGFRRLHQYGLRSLRGAGEFFQFNATVGIKNSSYSINWVKPFIYDTPWTIGFSLMQETTRYVSSDYYFRNLGGTFNAYYRMNAFMQLGWYYRLKYSYTKRTGKPEKHRDERNKREDRAQDEISDVKSVTEMVKEAGFEESDNDRSEYEKETGIRGLISALGTRFLYDTRDNTYDPRRGWQSILSFEFAGVGGPFRFMSFSYLNAYYYPVRNWGVIRLRGDLKFLQPWGGQTYEGLPLDERLFLGEEFYVRGYRPYKIGPTFPDKPNAPRGGLSLQYVSAEYAHIFSPSVEGFVFFDGGALNKTQWDFGTDMRFSVGIGTRFQLIQSIPPLTVGFGWPLNPKDRSEVKRFFISVGGQF